MSCKIRPIISVTCDFTTKSDGICIFLCCEHRVFSYEECGIPAHMPGWRHQWEEDCGKKCQRWVGTRDSTGCCEHEGCNIAVFTRTLVSILHSQWRNHHLFRRKNRMVQPDSLNVGLNVKIGKYSSNPWPEVGGGTSCHHGAEVDVLRHPVGRIYPHRHRRRSMLIELLVRRGSLELGFHSDTSVFGGTAFGPSVSRASCCLIAAIPAIEGKTCSVLCSSRTSAKIGSILGTLPPVAL